MERFEARDQITNHRFLKRLHNEHVDLGNLWRLLANFQVSVSKNFAAWLAAIIARVEDERIRCLLTEQLYDEMGRGDPTKIHTVLFSNMMKTLERFRPPSAGDDAFGPGRTLHAKLVAIYGAPDVNEGVGALMAGEVFGKQMDGFIAEEFRRQREVDVASLDWLVLHEELEVNHAASSSDLAQLLAPTATPAAWRGAYALSVAAGEFLDDLYSLCYEEKRA